MCGKFNDCDYLINEFIYVNFIGDGVLYKDKGKL